MFVNNKHNVINKQIIVYISLNISSARRKLGIKYMETIIKNSHLLKNDLSERDLRFSLQMDEK